MKKLSKLMLAVLAVVCLSVVFTSCFLFPDDTTTTTTKPAPDPSTDPVIESISVSGQKTDFFTGDEFATGDLLVTLHYDDGTSTEATAEQYTVDSSAFVKETAGEYEITVALKDSDIKTSYTVTVVDPVATSISLASQKTVFLTGDEFSVGEMVVTLHYNNGSTLVVPADQYTVDSSAFNKDAAGEYKITVSLNGTEFSAEYTVAVDTRYYDVTLPEGIILNTGVENGKTTVNATITFTAEAPAEGKHNVVKVNGTDITPVDGVYSVKASDYLTTLDATIVVTIAQEAHSFGEWVDGEDSRTRTCACGASETENKISVTLKLNNGEADKTVKLYAGEKLTAPEAPTKAGYTFKSWQFDGADFDFDTAITAPITLYATYNESTYSVEIYEQGVDGEYTLATTLEKTALTDSTVTLNGSEYTPDNSDLSFYKEYAENVVSGKVLEDGSLVLKLYYAYSAKLVYEASFYGELKEIVVTGISVSQVSANVLQNGEKVGETLTATVENGIATIDASSLKLANTSVQIELLDDVISPAVTISTVDSLDLGTELYNGFANYQGGMVFAKQNSCPEVTDEGKLMGTNAYVYPNDFLVFNFANIAANIKTVSISAELSTVCGCGGSDGLVFWEIHGKNGFSTGVVIYDTSAAGTLTLSGDLLRAANISQLGFDLLLGCTGNGHGPEWIDLGIVAADLSYETNLKALYREVTIETKTVYETSFYGDLKNINVQTSAEDGTEVKVNVLQNGEKVGETLTATVENGVAVIDASSLNLTNTKIQVEVVSDVSIDSIILDTVDSLDLGVSLNNDMQGYEGGMQFSVNSSYMPDETGKVTMPNQYIDAKDLVVFNISNILANLKSLSFSADYTGYCGCGGYDYIVFWELHNSGKGINGLVVANRNTTGAEVIVSGTFSATGDQLRNYGSGRFGLDYTCGCTGNGHGPEWTDLGIVSAELSYTATATQVYAMNK